MHIETLTVGQFQVNCYLAWNEQREAIVIDPGAEASGIVAAIDRLALDVRAYLLTHAHVDHISALAALHRRYPAVIGLHEDDLAWAFNAANSMPPWYNTPERPTTVERVFHDGDVFDDIGYPCRIVSTPGHTPGGACLYFESEGVCFAGDTLFAGSVGRTDLPGGNGRVLAQSLKRVAELPDTVTVYPGHGPATNIGHEKATNYFIRQVPQ